MFLEFGFDAALVYCGIRFVVLCISLIRGVGLEFWVLAVMVVQVWWC